MNRLKYKLQNILKYKWGIIVMSGFILVALLTLIPYNNLQEHFLKYDSKLAKVSSTYLRDLLMEQEDDKYYVSTYMKNEEHTQLLKSFERVKKETGVNYYLVDMSKIDFTLEKIGFNSQTAYLGVPQYWCIKENSDKEKTFLYQDVGYQSSENIKITTDWIDKNGMPINDISKTENIDDDYSLTFSEISSTTNDNNELFLNVSFNVDCLLDSDDDTENEFIINSSDFTIESKGNNITPIFETITVKKGTSDVLNLKFIWDENVTPDDMTIKCQGFEWNIKRPTLK